MTDKNADLIKTLPGYSKKLPSKTYGGYIPLSNNKNIYYMFIEAEKAPSKAPLLFWTNGGPGCSGLIGLFHELGPYRPTRNGKLAYNPFTWTKFANVVFMEQPIGVGFSWSKNKKNYKSDDEKSAKDNLEFILNFFLKYPEYRANPLYLTSESYGGHYIPLWAREIVNYNKRDDKFLNLKGMMIGNPYVNYLSGIAAQIESYWGHQMIPKELWKKFTKRKCNQLEGKKNWRKTWKKNRCQSLSEKIEDLVGKHNPYAVDYPLCVTNQQSNLISFYKKGRKTIRKKYNPCVEKFTETYLNRKDVKDAIHAKNLKTNWKPCSDISRYSEKDSYVSIVPVINKLLNDPNLKDMDVLIMSGTEDAICATVGTQKWLKQLDITPVKKWKQYFVNKNPAGYMSKYNANKQKKLWFATVIGAGHELPLYRPEIAYHLMKKFVFNKL